MDTKGEIVGMGGVGGLGLTHIHYYGGGLGLTHIHYYGK